MDKTLFQSWKRSVPHLEVVLEQMQEKAIIAVGGAAYPKIIPSLFLKDYAIYAVKDAADIDVLRNYTKVFCLEEKFPKVAAKVRSNSYLLGSYAFQAFLKSRQQPFRLMFYQPVTASVVKILDELRVEWSGNAPESFEDVFLRGRFRELLEKLGLPHLPDWKLSREEFLEKSYDDLHGHWARPVAVQRSDFEVWGEQGTFFIHEENDLRSALDILTEDTRYKEVLVSPFVEGHSVSMLGCITHKGVLTSMLQLQLIDVPEALHGQLGTGVFLGHDWGFCDWPDTTEKAAQQIVESIGEYLATKGFTGVFGIDFMYDKEHDELYPLECNPRFTAALPAFSLMITKLGNVPPIEFFHIMAQLNIKEDFDFQAVNEGFKQRIPFSHISLTPKGVYEMKLNLAAGVYSFSPADLKVRYERPGVFLWDLKNDTEFIMIDAVPRFGAEVTQNVPLLFEFIFPRSIALSSYSIDPQIGQLIKGLSIILREDQKLQD